MNGRLLCLLALAAFLGISVGLQAQQSLIETIVGSSNAGVPGAEFSFNVASGLAADTAGNIYFTVQALGQVFRLDKNGLVTVYAGNGVHAKNREEVAAVNSPLSGPSNLAMDSAGNLFISTASGVLRVDTNGVLTTVLMPHYRQPGTESSIDSINAMTIGPDGLLYVCDGGDQRIKSYSFSTGAIRVVAGNGTRGHAQPRQLATESPILYPESVAVAADGIVYFTDQEAAVFRINPGNGFLEALNIHLKNEGDGGDYEIPGHIALDGAEHLFVSQPNRARVLRIDLKSYKVAIFAGIGAQRFNGDDKKSTQATITAPRYVTVDASGDLVIAEEYRLRRVEASSGLISTIAGNGLPGSIAGRTSAREAKLWEPANVALAPDGSLYITSSFSQRLLVVDPQGNLTVAAGGGSPGLGEVPGPALQISLNYPQGIWPDGDGHVYFSDYDNRIVRRLSAGSRTVTNFATTPRNYNSGGVYLYHAGALVGDANYFYLSDPTDHHVWRISRRDSSVTPYAGTGTVELNNEDSEKKKAKTKPLFWPSGLALDSSGNLFVADAGLMGTKQGSILRVDAADGKITTVLKNLQQPEGLAFASPGVLCFSEAAANRVSCLDLASGKTRVVAGTGVGGFAGDGGPAECAKLNRPSGISFDHLGNLYIADTGNQRIRRVRMGTGTGKCE